MTWHEITNREKLQEGKEYLIRIDPKEYKSAIPEYVVGKCIRTQYFNGEKYVIGKTLVNPMHYHIYNVTHFCEILPVGK